jgi:hypothetical protein
MTTISNAKLSRLALKKMSGFEHRILRAVSKNQLWSDLLDDSRFDDAMDTLLDLNLVERSKEKWNVTNVGMLVLDKAKP